MKRRGDVAAGSSGLPPANSSGTYTRETAIQISQSVAKDAATTSLVARTAERRAPLDAATVVTIRLIREPRLD